MTSGSKLLPRPCVHGCGTAVFLAVRAPTPTGQPPKWLPFEAADRDPSKAEAVNCRAVVGIQAWRPGDLVEHLMVTREISEEKARELVDTYPHHLLHVHPDEGSEQ